MLLRKFLILLIFFFFSSTSMAQIRIGVLASANNTSLSGDTPNNASYGSYIGYGFGPSFDYHFTQDIVLNLQPMYTDKS